MPRKSMKFGFRMLTAFILSLSACLPARTEATIEKAEQHGIIEQDDQDFAAMRPAIYQLEKALPRLMGKRLAIVANHTSTIGEVHLLDTLLRLNLSVSTVFAPEHGFRGDAADGATVDNSIDPSTGIPVISLYGKNKKPTVAQFANIDLIIFDIQDVGARFYTYLSTLHYVMETCAEAGIPLLVLDRPNPNGQYIDGPVLEMPFSSFVGMHPVPVVYGMTIGEYAQMINGEKWLKSGMRCELDVLPCVSFERDMVYELPVKPSPNLPDMDAVRWYPSLCFFEGTVVSVGRGTERPFTVIGEPNNTSGNFTFTPRPVVGASTNPPQNGVLCRGYNLASVDTADMVTGHASAKIREIDLSWLLKMYAETSDKPHFFNSNLFFDKLAGTDKLRKAILSGESESAIRKTWQSDLDGFKIVRSKYLLYPDID